MESGHKGQRGGRSGVLVRGALALALACAGIAAGPGAARAAGPGPGPGSGSVACAAGPGAVDPGTVDPGAAGPGARGPAGAAVPGSLVSVARRDGRISQVRLFSAAAGPAHPGFAWHREQVAPDGPYGPWRRVGGTAASPGSGPVSAAENAAGDLEVRFTSGGSLCRTVRKAGADGWSTPLDIGPASATTPGGGRFRPKSVERAPDAGSTGPARLEVERTAGLLDGDIVTFTITGGPPKAYVWVKQCGPSASAATCDDATGRQFRVLPDGTYRPSPKKLYARLGAPAGDFDCRTASAGGSCTLALTDNDGAVLAAVPLRFRPHGGPEAPPTLRVHPARGLVDGQTVRATGKGYEPRYHSLVMQCAAGSSDTLGCRPRSRPPATTDDGRVDEEVALSSAFTAIDGRAVDCRPKNSCELVVFGTRVRGPETVRHSLSFAPVAVRSSP
ncbi:neocarzinostatin apoprotein domain-containing protein [Streptomyces sp. 4.24]|uniref:neocarzinostatin apoprotein domain-containing protein n=1 Tax=Streptomyces tritrimontium TaxID=3406573 RepID=UPI003BB520AE